ncbi:MAG TPA: hypothetical protein ENK88_03660 [Campylobacterales bacterium]|nr:hypothetical protein [Campylobacterales bacterium]
MRKIVVLFFTLLLMAEAKEYSVNIYTIEIDVNSTKADGRAWDVAGGAPDILLYIDGKEMRFNKKCRDKYRCSMEFMSRDDRNSWYFEVYDRDFVNSDLIGKGDCEKGDKCNFGLVTIRIKD